MIGLVTLEHSGFPVLLKNSFGHICMVGSTDENILIAKVFEMPSFNKEFGTVCNLEVWIFFVIALGGTGYNCTLDDRSEPIR